MPSLLVIALCYNYCALWVVCDLLILAYQSETSAVFWFINMHELVRGLNRHETSIGHLNTRNVVLFLDSWKRPSPQSLNRSR